MRNNHWKLLAIYFVAISLSSSVLIQDALSQSQKSFLWRVQSKANTVYVLGSLHLSKKEIYPLNQKIESAFDQSNVLVVEANINDIKKVDIQKLMESAFYPA